MTKDMIIVGMADMQVVKHPGILTTLGLGSCVGIALYDPLMKIAGLAHIMLPDSTAIPNSHIKAKFADTAIIDLILRMSARGANKGRLISKLAGGAQMFAFNSTIESMRIGDRNVEACEKKLNQLHIPIVAKETGSNYGRTVELYTEDGRFVIKTIGHGMKVI